jgi:hypothetical protein
MSEIEIQKKFAMTAIKALFSFLLIFAVFAPVCATAVDDNPSFAQFSKAAKVYLRDSAEFPLNEKIEVTFTDRAGRVRKRKTGRYKYDFHGYNPRSNKGTVSLKYSWGTALFGGPLKKAVYATSIPTMLLGILLDSDMEKNATITPGASPDLVAVALQPGGDCAPFQWENEGYASGSFCGSYNVLAEKDDFVLKHFAFEAARFPVPATMDVFGQVNILRYHSEMAFQRVFLPGDPKPFLVPKLVTVTVETDKGKLLMTGDFVPAMPRK